MLTNPRVPSFWFVVYKLFSSWIWLKYCLLDLKQSINQSIRSFFLYSFISSFFSIVTFLGWTWLQATWIKPEVVATKKYTGYLHYRRFITTWSRFLWSPRCSYMCFLSSCVALPIVCPSMLSCFRCSRPFLVSKRFGFWPHITHVIVLTFKEIMHLSDCRIIGLTLIIILLLQVRFKELSHYGCSSVLSMFMLLFIYVFLFSSCMVLSIFCPSMISCFRCSGPFFGE
jgi:hypothetical protein